MDARETWAKRVRDWKASGLTPAAFAAKHGIKEASLKWWKWRLSSTKKRSKPTGAVSPLTFVEMSVGSDAIEVVLASGITVRVPARFDADALGRLLDLLEKRG